MFSRNSSYFSWNRLHENLLLVEHFSNFYHAWNQFHENLTKIEERYWKGTRQIIHLGIIFFLLNRIFCWLWEKINEGGFVNIDIDVTRREQSYWRWFVNFKQPYETKIIITQSMTLYELCPEYVILVVSV